MPAIAPQEPATRASLMSMTVPGDAAQLRTLQGPARASLTNVGEPAFAVREAIRD